MKVVLGSICGLIVGSIIFLVIYFNELLLMQNSTGLEKLVLTMHLNETINFYLLSGLIVGAIVGLSKQKNG